MVGVSTFCLIAKRRRCKRLVFTLLCFFALNYEWQLFTIIVQKRIGRLFSNVLHNHQVAAQMPL